MKKSKGEDFMNKNIEFTLKNGEDFELIISQIEKAVFIKINLVKFNDYGDFLKWLLEACKFYLKHCFTEFELFDTDSNTRYHIILTLDDVVVVSYNDTDTNVMRFVNFDCWYFIREIVLSIIRDRNEWNEYFEKTIYDMVSKIKMNQEIDNLITDIKTLLATFEKYEIK